ncbi:hypothetical protein STENM223S_11203 [Streptomyces tendae]
MDLARLPHDDRPFALLRRRTPGHDHDVVELLTGPVTARERLADLPDEGLALVPFRQIRERGFDVRDDGTPLLVLTPEERREFPLAEALAALPAHDVRVEGGGFDVGDEEYARIVGRVLDEEIGRGEGANFVIRRTYRGHGARVRAGRRAGAVPAAAGGRAGRVLDVRRPHRGDQGARRAFRGRAGVGNGAGARSSGRAPRCTCGRRAGRS